MTLYRQLIFGSLIILFCLCLGLWMGEFKRTRDFLADQMATNAQDTASSLGLSLTTLADGTDIMIMEAMINALFDRGYYRAVELVDMEGKVLAGRRSDMALESVPPWFIRLVPLNAPRATSLVMSGWRQVGEITVECHPGYAYRTLWRAAWTTALWFSLTGVACALLGGLGLRAVLKPLRRVEEQAMALCDRQFQIQETLPRTRELRCVVTAMNRMTTTIREMFQEQAAIADSLRELSYQDSLTGIGNRRYLEAQVKARLDNRERSGRGALLLFQIQHLQAINVAKGYQEGDRVIKETARLIAQGCGELPEVMLGRIGGGDFVVFLPHCDEPIARQLAEDIVEATNRQNELGVPPATRWTVVCGGVLFEQAAGFGQLIAQADTALSTARYNDNNQVAIGFLGKGQGAVGGSRTEWRSLLEQIISRRTIVFYSQPIVHCLNPREIVLHEVLTRVVDQVGRHVSPGVFLPTAERLGMMPALDRMILERIFELPHHLVGPHRTAVNLSPLSLADHDFVTWLHPQLERCGQQGLRLNFEFPEFRAIRHLEAIKTFSQTIKRHGHQVGIDHFGQGLVNFGYLKSLLPDYVKIDRAITLDLSDEQSDQFFFISTLCTVAHSLDVRVIVEGVENESQWRLLTRIPIDAVQGFYIQPPAPLLSTAESGLVRVQSDGYSDEKVGAW